MNSIPSIHDENIKIHKPTFLESWFYKFGYISCYINAYTNFKDPLARKNIITGTVSIKRYNESFSCWNWCKVEERWSKHFKSSSIFKTVQPRNQSGNA